MRQASHSCIFVDSRILGIHSSSSALVNFWELVQTLKGRELCIFCTEMTSGLPQPSGVDNSACAGLSHRRWTENSIFRNKDCATRLLQMLNGMRRSDFRLCDKSSAFGCLGSAPIRSNRFSFSEVDNFAMSFWSLASLRKKEPKPISKSRMNEWNCQPIEPFWPLRRHIFVPCSQVRGQTPKIASYNLQIRLLLLAEMAESRQQRIFIQEVNPRALAALLDYMYTSEIHITEDNVQVRPLDDLFGRDLMMRCLFRAYCRLLTFYAFATWPTRVASSWNRVCIHRTVWVSLLSLSQSSWFRNLASVF